MKSSEFTLVVVSLSHDLNLGAITLQINKDERVSSTADGQNTASESHSHVLNEGVVFRDGLVVLDAELVDAVRACKLVRVRVHVLVAQGLNKVLSILRILRRVLLFLLEGSCEVFLLGCFFTSGSLGLLSSPLGGGLLGHLLLLLSLLLALFELAKRKQQSDVS